MSLDEPDLEIAGSLEQHVTSLKHIHPYDTVKVRVVGDIDHLGWQR